MEINRIGNKNCWIKNGFQYWRFFNRGCLLILGDHLFLNCIFLGEEEGVLLPSDKVMVEGVLCPGAFILYDDGLYIISRVI